MHRRDRSGFAHVGTITALLFAAGKYGVSADPTIEYVMPDKERVRTVMGRCGSNSKPAHGGNVKADESSGGSGSGTGTTSSSNSDSD